MAALATAPSGALKRKRKAPPEGYVCKLCKTSGHWVYECELCEKKPKEAKAAAPSAAEAPAAKPNPCVSTEEARIKCHCGLRAIKRRFFSGDAPEYRWICGRMKKHKIKRGDTNMKRCKFSRPVTGDHEADALAAEADAAAEGADGAAGTPTKRVNTRYIQRDKKRKLKCKVFVSGLPFSSNPVEVLAEFFQDQGCAPPVKVATLKKGGRKTGQAYATFADVAAADAALALSGTKCKENGRWLDFKRVADAPDKAARPTAGADDDDSDDDDSADDAGRETDRAAAGDDADDSDDDASSDDDADDSDDDDASSEDGA